MGPLGAVLLSLLALSAPVGSAAGSARTGAVDAGAPETGGAPGSARSPDPVRPSGSGGSMATEPTTAGPPDGPVPPTDAGNVTRANVTLVTGQTVTVVRRDGETTYRVDGGVTMHEVHAAEGIYVYPEGVNFSRFDPAMFNVDLLFRENRTDAETDSVPVVVRGPNGETAGGSGTADGDRDGPGVPGDRPARELAPSFIESVSGTAALETNSRLESVGAVGGEISKSSAGRAYESLRSDPAVERVYYDRRVEVSLDGTNEVTRADDARRRFGVDGSGVTVAVLDTGVDDTHPELPSAVVHERDFTGDGRTDDPNGHGTHAAGIVAGRGNASDGRYVGIAPDASVMELRVLEADGYGSSSDIIDAMEYADRRGRRLETGLRADRTTTDPIPPPTSGFEGRPTEVHRVGYRGECGTHLEARMDVESGRRRRGGGVAATATRRRGSRRRVPRSRPPSRCRRSPPPG